MTFPWQRACLGLRPSFLDAILKEPGLFKEVAEVRLGKTITG